MIPTSQRYRRLDPSNNFPVTAVVINASARGTVRGGGDVCLSPGTTRRCRHDRQRGSRCQYADPDFHTDGDGIATAADIPNAGVSPHSDTQPDTESHANAHSNTDPDCNPFAHTHADPDSQSNADTDTDADTNTNSDSDANADT